MPSHCLFATIDVRHDYFADGHARHLLFLPHKDTLAFLRRFRVLQHANGHSLAIMVPESQLQDFWSERMEGGEPRVLRFDVHSMDAACVYYTGSVTTLSQSDKDGALPATLLSMPAAATAPWATVALPLDTATSNNDFPAWVSSLGKTYRLRMHSRSTIWKYLLAGDWGGRVLSIVDQRGEVNFTAPAQERLPNGQYALAARSTSLIALREQPLQRFQLCDVTHASAKVLIPRLPDATPQRLQRETMQGASTHVSEILVP
jgi:hypothetical protein